MEIRKFPAWIYQQYDADHALEHPGESFGGWKRTSIDVPKGKTALLSMHAWNVTDDYPGWDRCIEYRPRSRNIMRTVFPPLFDAVRSAGVPLVHVAGCGKYHHQLPGYQAAVELAGRTTNQNAPGARRDEFADAIDTLKASESFVGEHNQTDVGRGFANNDFAPETRPIDGEYVVENTSQLNAVCRHLDVWHLVYVGFAINWCLVHSSGGMADMKRLGYICSTIREAVTAVENKESARGERHKEYGLWWVAMNYGVVFDLEPFVNAIG